MRAASSNAASTARPMLFISYHFPPNKEMGARTCAQIARYLPWYGWRPLILTVEKEYIEKQYLDESDKLAAWGLLDFVARTKPWPHPFDLYRFGKKLFSPSFDSEKDGGPAAKENPEKISGANGDGQGGGLRQYILSLLSIPDPYTGWIPPTVYRGLRMIKSHGVEAIFSSAPYMSNHLAAYFLSKLSGLPWIAHFRDPYAKGVSIDEFLSSTEERMAEKIERLIVAQASRVICVTEEHCLAFRAEYPDLPSGKFSWVPNGFDGGDWDELDSAPPRAERGVPRADDKFRITYAGKLYIKRNPMPVFRALRRLIDAGEIPPERVKVDLIGWCEVSEGQSVADQIAELGLHDVANVVGPLSHQQTLRELSRSDLLLLLAEELTAQIPGKTFEYLKTNRPILALAPEGAVARLLRQTGGGWTVESNDLEGVIAAIRECYKAWESGAPGRTPNQKIVNSYDRRVTTKEIADLLNNLAPNV